MKLRNVVLVVMLGAIVAAGSMAQARAPWLGTHYQPGNIALSLGAGIGFGGGLGVSLYPGAEFIFSKIRPADAFSLDFGAGVRGAFTFWSSTSTPTYGFISLGGAPFLSAHMGLRGFSDTDLAEYLGRLDIFTSLGLGYQAYVPTGSSAPIGGGLALATFSGINYFLSENFAVALGANYFHSFGSTVSAGAYSTSIGIVYKIGPSEEIGERVSLEMPDFTVMTGDLMYAQFATLYWVSIALGGYLPSDETFEVGDGIRFYHRYMSPDDDDVEEIEFTRSLLHANADGSRWWRFVFFLDDEQLPFEALVGDDDGIRKIRYLDPESEAVVTHAPSDPYLWRSYEDDYRTAEDLGEMRVGSERVTVAAGTFRAERLETAEDDYEYTWWVTDEVPGRVVKFEGITPDADSIRGELLKILDGVTTPWEIPW